MMMIQDCVVVLGFMITSYSDLLECKSGFMVAACYWNLLFVMILGFIGNYDCSCDIVIHSCIRILGFGMYGCVTVNQFLVAS